MLLTTNEQRNVAQLANFMFNCWLGPGTGDSVVFTGDGVDDLDRLIAILASGTERGAKFQVDVGGLMGGQGMGYYSVYRNFDMDDLAAIRGFYIGWYGDSAKPNAYVPEPAVSFPLPQTQVSVDP
jgi:hypothetical protein